MNEITKIYNSLFFFNDTATTEIYTLSLHDALPISGFQRSEFLLEHGFLDFIVHRKELKEKIIQMLVLFQGRSEEHTSELQSRQYLVCRLLLEKKQKPHHHVPLHLHISPTQLSGLLP